MVKCAIRSSAKKVNTSEKQKRAGERNILLHSSGKYSMHHSDFSGKYLMHHSGFGLKMPFSSEFGSKFGIKTPWSWECG